MRMGTLLSLARFVLFASCLVAVLALPCMNDCYDKWDQGTCNNKTGKCDCTMFYKGPDCSTNNDPYFDWDHMDCHGGRFYAPIFYYGWERYCVCPPGWEGVDCGVCMNNLGCASWNPNKTRCDKTMYINQNKHFNCSVTDASILADLGGRQAVAIALTSFANASQVNGNASLEFYFSNTGSPLAFWCNFTQCSKVIDQAGTQTVHCLQTTCNYTSWVKDSPLAPILDAAATTMDYICTNKGECSFSQTEMTITVQLQCSAGECLDADYVPVIEPPSDYLRVALTIGIGCASFILCAFAAYGAYALMKIRKVYAPLPHIEATMSFQNISCTITKKGAPDRVVIHNATGDIMPGSVTAIMGSSGAGKTTFLDILAQRKNTGKVSGNIYVNGVPWSTSMKRLMGYVTQDDVFLGTLTVREYLRYTAQLRLPAHMDKEQQHKKVDEVLQELGIFHIRDSRIGTTTTRGISGGERKRLAIAAELIVDPSILLLDEPTSGLDSYSASSLCQTLQKLAHGVNKRTIIMSIHQPRSDIFQMFDYLMVFSGGHIVYFGESSKALAHFALYGHHCPPHFNPADFIIDAVSSPEFNAQVVAAAPRPSDVHRPKSSGSFKAVMLEGIDEYASSFWTQFFVLTHRTFVHALRNPFLLRIQYTVFIIVALMLGYLYWHITPDLLGMQNRMGSLFFMCTLLSFAAITSIDLFYSERLLFLRERANGCYRTSAYFLSKTVSDLVPMRVFPPLIMGAIVYYMIGYQARPEKLVIFLCTLVLLSMTATSMCFLISSLAPSIAVGNFIAILVLFFFLLFGGFLVSTSSMPASIVWLTNISFMKFSYSALMVNEFNGINILVNLKDMSNSNPTMVQGVMILNQLGMDVNSLYNDLIVLAGMLALYLVGSYLALRFAVKEKR